MHWKFILLFAFCGFSQALSAQSAGALYRKGASFWAKGDLSGAAEWFEKAALAGKKSAYLDAADCYYRLRDYTKAAECFGKAPKRNAKDPFGDLRYARALKQSGQYTEAIEAFQKFVRQYKGAYRAQFVAVSETEIKGCQISLAEATAIPLFIRRLPDGVNGPQNEFAPSPFNDRVLYFSVIDQDRVRFMRTQRDGPDWSAAVEAGNLPTSLVDRFGNGVFSEDGLRFYCTQCSERPLQLKSIGTVKFPVCAIYVLEKKENTWTEFKPLGLHINWKGTTAMHPFSVTVGNTEYLYFSSNRPGSIGGLDIYRCMRKIQGQFTEFSLPQNVGPQINTPGDDITPFFDKQEQALWFSSNGHPGLGGMDVFKSLALPGGGWSKPTNALHPLNTMADDLFFVLKPDRKGFFIVSNRLFGEEKTSTRDQDLFEADFN